MTFDEMLVAIIKGVPEVEAVCKGVHHLEVYQANFSQNVDPCVLFSLRDNVRNTVEVSGVSGYCKAFYNVTVVAKDSETIRVVAQGLFDLAEEESNFLLYDEYAVHGFDWLDTDNDAEEIEYASELQDKGFKTASILFTLYHREPYNYVKD